METKNTGPGDCIPGFCSKLLCDITQDPLLLQALPSISTLGASSQVVPKALAHSDSLCRLYLPFSLGWGSSSGCARDREGQLVRFLEGPAGTGIHAHHGFLSTCAMSGPAQGPASSRLLPPLPDGLHRWPTLQAARLTQVQRTQTPRLLEIGLLTPLPL